ncbi:dethiobiotin synthase [Marivirga atlantica]|uniref:ATP-dependent dethiobiotin synthetase BioD n=1 Tax=Marivirga atlantica TaxID=1548457 RepID=A0A937DGP0_9BACT|nr:dethiobiotin synthase [Marivirga atlantica]MBL0764988.1 dethiobiotin synthase [Marivirga atlantica]
MNYFVTAIGTDSGKTLVSAILTEALHADYWKPVQAGFPKDSEAVEALLSNTTSKILPEQYVLNTPASPHYAAEVDRVSIHAKEMTLPFTKNRHLIIEGAGGALVPLNDKEFVIDITNNFPCEVILVCNLYLGSINHSLLTLNELKHRNVKVKGIIFNGPSNPSSESIIVKHAQLPVLLNIKQEEKINKEVVRKYASIVREQL